MRDDERLDRLQRGAFAYFVDQTNPENGLVADTSRTGSPASASRTRLAIFEWAATVDCQPLTML